MAFSLKVDWKVGVVNTSVRHLGRVSAIVPADVRTNMYLRLANESPRLRRSEHGGYFGADFGPALGNPGYFHPKDGRTASHVARRPVTSPLIAYSSQHFRQTE